MSPRSSATPRNMVSEMREGGEVRVIISSDATSQPVSAVDSLLVNISSDYLLIAPPDAFHDYFLHIH